MEKLYYTIQEVMTVTGLSRSTVLRRIRDGTLPVYKYSEKPLIPKDYVIGEKALTKYGRSDEKCREQSTTCERSETSAEVTKVHVGIAL